MSTTDARLLAAVLEAFRPPARPSSAEWAEANIRLTSEMAARPGPLRLTVLQRQILDAIDDPAVQVVVLQLSAQQGKSTVILAALLRILGVDPGPILHVSPSEGKAKDWSRTTLEPLLVANPDIKALIGKDANGAKTKGGAGGDSVLFRSFPGGSLSLASAHKAEDLAARAIRFLFLDEVDRFPASAGKEGDPVTLAFKRTKTFPNRKVILASTPTATNASRINEWYRRGSMERFAIPCSDCGCLFVPTHESLKYDEGKPRSAKLECTECGHHMTERERLRALPRGTFVATNDAAEEGIRSFHASEAVSPFSTLPEIATADEAAKDPAAKRVYVNTCWAETFDAASEAERDAGELQSRAVPLPVPLPRDIRYVTAGVDVQANRLEMTILAHAPTRRLVVDHLVIGGDPTGEDVWNRLAGFLARTITVEGGRNLPLSATFVDAGYLASNVHAFAAKHPRVHAIIGRAGWDRPSITRGHRIANTPRRLLVLGVDNLKLIVAKALKLDTSEAGHIVLPDHLEADYFEQLANEKLVTKFVRGYPVQKWTPDNERSESFDCLVYAIAAGLHVKVPAAARGDEPKSKTIEDIAASFDAIGRKAADVGGNIVRFHNG